MNIKELILNNGMKTIIDNEDFEEVSKYKWGVIQNKKYIYASRGTRKKGEKYSKILLHRFLMKVNSKDQIVDHINGNTLDNRKSNLRITDKSGNLRNSKLRNDSYCKYKGVHKKISKVGTIRYSCRIQISPNKRLFLGWFKTEIEAAKIYNDAAIKYFGEFAKLNKL